MTNETVGVAPTHDMLASMSYEQWLDHHRAQPGGWLTTAAPAAVLRDCYEQRLNTLTNPNETEEEL